MNLTVCDMCDFLVKLNIYKLPGTVSLKSEEFTYVVDLI